MLRYVIIGNGVAGFAAAEAIREQDSSGDVLIIGDDPHGFYSRPGLAYFISGEISERFLSPFSEEEERSKTIHRRRAHVASIDPAAHRVALSDGTTVPYDRLLLGTGAVADGLRIPGMDLEGVIKLDHMDDALHFLDLARKGRTAVVVGGGITALELVEGLVARGVHTHYFMRGERYWSNVLNETESQIIEHRLQEHGVELHFRTGLAEITGYHGKVVGALTQEDILVPCQIIGVAIGIHPRKELAEDCELKTGRGILVDEFLRTSAADIFAAGDVAQFFDRQTGQTHLDSLWGTARQQGRLAGLNMSGGQVSYEKKLALNVTSLAGITTTIIGMVGGGRDSDLAGIARGDSESWRQTTDSIAVQEGSQSNRLRLQVGRQVIIGALIMGNQAYSQPLQELVSAGADISPIREKLLRPGAPLGGLIVDFWYKWKRGCTTLTGAQGTTLTGAQGTTLTGAQDAPQ